MAARPSLVTLSPTASAEPATSTSDCSSTVSDVAVPRRRGRRRTLSPMTNSERARYYRQQHAQLTASLEAATDDLRNQVFFLELQLRVHRELMRRTVAPAPLHRILTFVQRFVAVELATKSHGLTHQRHDVVSVDLGGDANAPVVCVRSHLHGRLTTEVVHRIYPFVLGNTVVLDELLHQEITYACAHVFFFSSDGAVERESAEIDVVSALQRPLQSLRVAARVVRETDVLMEDTDADEGAWPPDR